MTNNKTTIKMLNLGTMKKRKSLNNSTPEKDLGNNRLFWKESQESQKRKSMKCINENSIKGDKIKSYFPPLKITKHIQFSVRWARKTRLFFQFWKKLNISKRLKMTNSKSKSPQQWQWEKSTQERFSFKLQTKRPFALASKDWLTST